MSDQKQHVGSQSLAIQSGGNTTINQGVSPEDMQRILGILGESQLSSFVAIAKEIADVRVADLEKRLIEKFSDPRRADSCSFKDPDFQHLLTRAQDAYARSGDETVRDILVDLIASRSKETIRSRRSLTLNDAVEKAAVLTKNEFAELSLCFLIRHVRVAGVTDVATFGERHSQLVRPFLTDVTEGNSSYKYIEAQSCGTITVLESNLINALLKNYGGVFSRGFDHERLTTFLAKSRIESLRSSGLIVPCANESTQLQFNALNIQLFDDAARRHGLSEKEISDAWKMFESTFWNGEEFMQNVQKYYPEIRDLNHLWNGTRLTNLSLTTVGITIGHANLSRVTGFGTDLSVWIQ